MNEQQPYSGTLTAEKFMFREVRIVAPLYLEGLDLDETICRVKTDNLFQYPTERELGRMARVSYKRLAALADRRLVEAIVSEGAEDAKQINLYALMCYNRLVREFMIDVIGEKFLCRDLSFSRGDVNGFFSKLQMNDERVAAWSNSTVHRIKSVLVSVLVETGYLDDHRSTVIRSILAGSVLREVLIEKGDIGAQRAFNILI